MNPCYARTLGAFPARRGLIPSDRVEDRIAYRNRTIYPRHANDGLSPPKGRPGPPVPDHRPRRARIAGAAVGAARGARLFGRFAEGRAAAAGDAGVARG